MYLFFDTETTGLPKNYKASITDVDNWPRITQIAWQLYDKNENLVKERCNLIKPDGWTIPNEPFFIENNMSTERCEREGIKMDEMIQDFISSVDEAEYLIAHNIDFDIKIIGAEMIRYNKEFAKEPKKFCTKTEGTSFCKLPGKRGNYKWPTLLELHPKLFNEGFEGAHDALADARACARSFFEIKRLGLINDL